MEGDRRAAGFCIRRCPSIWIFNHQVSVNGQDAGVYTGLHDGKPPREVGDKMIIHDINMSDIGTGDLFQFVLKSGDIAIKNRRRNERRGHESS